MSYGYAPGESYSEQYPAEYSPEMMGYAAYGYPAMYGMQVPSSDYGQGSFVSYSYPPPPPAGPVPQSAYPQDPDGATHPCERVFGVCKGGDACFYKNVPRSACVSFLKGRCRFGASCRENHLSLQEGKAVPALHPCLRIFGSCKFGAQCEYASLPSSSCIKFLRGKCAFGDRCKEHHPLMGNLGGHFGGAVGSVETVGGTAFLPTAGLKRARDGSEESPVDAALKRQNLETGLHPCVRVFGTCHAGAACQFALVPSEACLRFLKGGCKFGEGCREQHIPPTPRTGSHPCVRIYGFCQHNPCPFANYPIESCLQFLKGKCKFGDGCRELHPAGPNPSPAPFVPALPVASPPPVVEVVPQHDNPLVGPSPPPPPSSSDSPASSTETPNTDTSSTPASATTTE